ncbi:MAG: hypothetical protein L0Z62_31885 [Gemmataceae bacterium]|nr:hypothetical protein [Gemmataceae bacterium]
MNTLNPIPRHKTAIRSNDFSRPVKRVLADGLVLRVAAAIEALAPWAARRPML